MGASHILERSLLKSPAPRAPIPPAGFFAISKGRRTCNNRRVTEPRLMVSIAPIIRRRVKIDFASARAERWSRDSKEFENALNAMSFLFPAGESFFINSVQNYLGKIADPVLKEEAGRFIYQEAMHSKEHARSNEVLKQAHPYGSEMERVARAMLAPSRRFAPKASQLATSCAIEHFTAMFADSILREQDHVREYNDPAFADLWLWHAVEETEHKAVCFDVYQHVVGKGVFAYLLRVSTMATVTLLGAAAIGVGFAIINWKQRRERRASGVAAATERTGAPSIRKLMHFAPLKLYLDYYRPSFHPWNHQNAYLIDQWKKAYGDFGLPKEAAPAAARA
jgi:predicted metal-dependent hydrolase